MPFKFNADDYRTSLREKLGIPHDFDATKGSVKGGKKVIDEEDAAIPAPPPAQPAPAAPAPAPVAEPEQPESKKEDKQDDPKFRMSMDVLDTIIHSLDNKMSEASDSSEKSVIRQLATYLENNKDKIAKTVK